MPSTELMRTEVTHHLILAAQLKENYAEIDDETVKDTLEGNLRPARGGGRRHPLQPR